MSGGEVYGQHNKRGEAQAVYFFERVVDKSGAQTAPSDLPGARNTANAGKSSYAITSGILGWLSS